MALVCFVFLIPRLRRGQLGVRMIRWFVIFVEFGPNCHRAIEQEGDCD